MDLTSANSMSNYDNYQQAMNWAANLKRETENAICEAIKEYEQQTGFRVDDIHYDRPGIFGDSPTPVIIKIRAIWSTAEK